MKHDPLDFHRSCKHFNGVGNERCKAGVCYREQFPTPWGQGRLGCINPDDPRHPNGEARCPSAEWPTQDEAKAALKKSNEFIQMMFAPIEAAHADAKARGLKRGSGGIGQVVCPNCGGALHYTVAASNGHLWGKCSTEGCASWME